MGPHSLCPSCDSPRIGAFRLDSDWGSGGDWSIVNARDCYTLEQLRDFDHNMRPDVECYVCCNCYTVFNAPIPATKPEPTP